MGRERIHNPVPYDADGGAKGHKRADDWCCGAECTGAACAEVNCCYTSVGGLQASG